MMTGCRGYVVQNEDGMLLALGHYPDGPKAGLLLWGLNTPVTLFPSRGQAREAVRRNIAYAVRHKLPWPKEYRISLVKAQ